MIYPMADPMTCPSCGGVMQDKGAFILPAAKGENLEEKISTQIYTYPEQLQVRAFLCPSCERYQLSPTV
jgi:hypothetical protein